jgi:hypothetical protein
MLSSTREPPRGTALRASAGLGLLPLAAAFIWACTALYVEVSPPRVDLGVLHFETVDLLANIGLYVPLGVALRRRRFLAAITAGAGLSATVEVLQLFYLDRYPALADVLANTAGLGAGWAAAKLGGGAWLSGIDPIPLNRRFALFAGALFVVGVFYLSVPGPPSDFANWDPSCRLIVADELTRDRPWKGSIETLAVFDRALSLREAERLSRDGGAGLELLSPLYLAGSLDPVDSIRGEPLLDEKRRIEFHQRLVAAGRMSVFVVFSTDDENQVGPARIVGYSKATLAHNFSLGQEKGEIVFRLRTRTTAPGGFYPQTRTRPILTRHRRTCVAATYDGQNVRVFADGRYEARLNLSALGRLSPFLSGSGLPASAAFIGALMGIVCAGLLGGPTWRYRLVVAGALGGMTGGFVLLAAGGAAAFPEFGPWLPVVSAWGGAVAGGSAVGPGDDRGALAGGLGARR